MRLARPARPFARTLPERWRSAHQRRLKGGLVIALVALGSSACSTVIRPTRPDLPLEPGPAVYGVRFEGDRVDMREVGMPLSNSRAWEREVENYAAKQLNTLLSTEVGAPTARTVVTFDLASPSPVQIGTWKEMTIELSTRLPGGQLVRSEPVTGSIDSPLEYIAVQGMAFTGSALDVMAAIASLIYVFNPSPLACSVFIGSLVGGLALNLGQSVAGYFVALSEESRWSNLFAEALKRHAEDIREAVHRSPSPPPGQAPEAAPTRPPGAPPLGVPPPPPLLDPVDDPIEVY